MFALWKEYHWTRMFDHKQLRKLIHFGWAGQQEDLLSKIKHN